MNETRSILLATAILAAGGIGLFMLKSNDDGTYDDEELELDEIEDLDDLDDLDLDDEYLDDDYDYKPKSKSNNKTKRNRKSGGSRKRY
jgi:hypothetical protein